MSFLITKILIAVEEHKCVLFHGIKLYIPKSHKYVVVDKSGNIRSYAKMPTINFEESIWESSKESWEYTGKCAFEGDWKESLVILED